MTESQGTELTVVERATQALAAVTTEEKLKQLAASSVGIEKITNAPGLTQCHAARMVLKNMRIEIERAGKAARDEATKFSKAVIAEEQRLIGIIEPEEARLARIQTEYEEAREAERRAKEEAERRRVAAIQERITTLREYALEAVDECAQRIAEMIKLLNETPVLPDVFQEFATDAELAKKVTLARLNALLRAAVEREAEAERLRLEREEFERQKAEQAERDRQAKAERDREANRISDESFRKLAELAEQERVALEARAEEDRRAAERRRAEEEEIARQRAAMLREREEFEARKRREIEEAEERARAEAEARRRQEEAHAEAQRQEQEAARSAERQRERENRPRPSMGEMAAVLAKAFDTTEERALTWLTTPEKPEKPAKKAKSAAAQLGAAP